jgi:hypothetical protein
MPERRRFVQTEPLEKRLADEAARLRKETQGTPPGIERERLIRKGPPSRNGFPPTGVANLTGATSTKISSLEMAIYRLLQNFTMEPETVSCITAAYEQALHTLCVKDRDDPLTEMIAKTIIKIAQTGARDPAQLAALAIKELGVR